MKFKAAVFGRHICQSTTACLIAMTQGDLTTVTLAHWIKALQTGVGTGIIGVLFTFGSLIKIQTNRYGVASIAFLGTVISDFLSHPTHFGSIGTEALVTGVGAALLCLGASFTPLGKLIERLGKV
jgi:hypothetical protein